MANENENEYYEDYEDYEDNYKMKIEAYNEMMDEMIRNNKQSEEFIENLRKNELSDMQKEFEIEIKNMKEYEINNKVNESEEAARNQDRKNAEAARNQDRKNAEAARKLVRQEHRFLNRKKVYEDITFFVKLTFNKLFSILKERGEIKECDAEEFLKSENTEEFQNQKIRYQNTLKEDLFEASDDSPLEFALKSVNIFGLKFLGLFNK